jgi:hypothetical protein
MKKLLLLSSMLFLGSCGNKDKTFKINTMTLTGKTDGTSSLKLEFTSLPKTTYGALKISGTYTNAVTSGSPAATTEYACKFVDLEASAVSTEAALTTLTLTGGATSLKGVVVDNDPNCKAAGTVSEVSLATGVISVTSDGSTYKNEAKADGAGTVA